MSAGSALRGTRAALEAAGAIPVVAGAILVPGDLGVGYFAQQRLPLVAVLRDSYELWTATPVVRLTARSQKPAAEACRNPTPGAGCPSRPTAAT